MTYPGQVGTYVIQDDDEAADYARTLVKKGTSFEHQLSDRLAETETRQHIFRVVY